MPPSLLLVAQLGPALAGGILALAFDAFDRRAEAVTFSVLGLVVSALFAFGGGTTMAGATAFDVARVGGTFSTVPGIIAVLAAVSLWGGWHQFTGRPGGGSAAALIAFAAVASAAVAMTLDLVMLLVTLETAAAAGYALVADAKTKRSDEAAMKYFIQGAIATGMLVMGLAILVGGFIPSAAYGQLAAVFADRAAPTAALAGALLILSALAFKSSLVPFHSWAPDAYESARPEVSSFLAAGPKLGAIGGMTLFMVLVASGPLAEQILVVVAVVAGLSVLVGSLGALRQRSYTRMLAYAGVAQAGYAVIGMAVLDPPGAVFFASTYAVATAGTFLAATAFRRVRPEWDGTIADLAGMGKRAPALALSLTVLLVSLAGVPPLLGFWGKFQVFAGAISGSMQMFTGSGGSTTLGWTYALMAIAGLVGSVVSLGYYGSVFQALFLADPPAEAEREGEVEASTPVEGSSAADAVALLAVAVVVLGLVPVFMGLGTILAPFAVG